LRGKRNYADRIYFAAAVDAVVVAESAQTRARSPVPW